MSGERFYQLDDTIIIARPDANDVIPTGAVEMDPVEGQAEVERLTGLPLDAILGGV